MKMKKKGERIRDLYRVLQAFPFIQGILYYTEVEPQTAQGSAGPLPTRFLHGLDVRLVRKGLDFKQILKRDRNAFFPLQGLFVEKGFLYQVFGRLEGTLLAHELYRSVPFTGREVVHILRSASGHLFRIYQQDLFTVVHPQNMLFTGESVRFLYGGPSGFLPKLGGEQGRPPKEANPEERKRKEQAVDAYSLGALAYTMLTGKTPSPGGNMPSVRTDREEIPPEMERLVMYSLHPNPRSRPRIEDWWGYLSHLPNAQEAQGRMTLRTT